jgi:hypothetical protein
MITDAHLRDRLQAIGAVDVRRGGVERLDFAACRHQLRLAVQGPIRAPFNPPARAGRFW